MKRLFQISGVKNKDRENYYGTKEAAKQARKQFNGVDDDGNEILSNGYRVAPGPDHRRYRNG